MTVSSHERAPKVRWDSKPGARHVIQIRRPKSEMAQPEELNDQDMQEQPVNV